MRQKQDSIRCAVSLTDATSDTELMAKGIRQKNAETEIMETVKPMREEGGLNTWTGKNR